MVQRKRSPARAARKIAIRDVTVGVDFGGTKIAAAAVVNGRIVKRVEVPTDAEMGRRRVIEQLRTAILTSAEGYRIARVGIGVPGLYTGTKIVLLSNVPSLNGVDIATALRPVVGKAKILLENDARCFALAEARLGAGKGVRHCLGITLGTGVGGGIVIDRKLYHGARGAAGEIGHTIIDNGLLSFRMGAPGDWESIVSGRAMVAYYQAHGGTRERVSDFWGEDSVAAQSTREFVSRQLAIFLANLISILDPERVVVGGGAASPDLVRRINALLPMYGARPIVYYAGLGADAGIIGASLVFDT